MNLHRYPLVLYWFREGPELGLYVIAAAPDYADTLGAKVNAIEGIQSQLLLEAVTPLISHENQSWLLLKSPNYLVTAEVLQAVGVLAQLGPAEFDLEDAAGRRTTRVVSPLEPGQMVDFQPALAEASRPLYVSRPQEDFWYEYLEDERTLYFRYNHCTDPLGFRRVTREFWRFTDEHEVQRVVVDLRSNGGGNSYQFNLWFLPGIQKRPELNRPDRLYLLINRGSFSAASQNAIDMDLQTEATVVGEATGGKPNGYGEVRALRLPNSGWQGWYSTNYFSQVEGDPPSLMPEVPVDMTAKAYFSGEDPVLEAVLEGG